MDGGEKAREFMLSYINFIRIQTKSRKIVYDFLFEMNQTIEIANAKSTNLLLKS